MKILKKSLAVLLGLAVALGISISAGAAELPGNLDNLPAITEDVTAAGTLTGTDDVVWYRFTPGKTGLYRVTVTGTDIVCNVHTFEVDEWFTDHYTSDATDYNPYVKGYTSYVEVLGTGDFTILIESMTVWEMIQEGFGDIRAQFTGLFSDLAGVGPLRILASIGTLPLFGIMLGFFFAPYSVGGTLIISLISALFLPLTLLLSPFILIDSITSWFK